MSYIILFAIFIIAIIGAPLFSVIGLMSILNFNNSGNSLLIVAQEMTSKLLTVPMLYSIPLFTLAGYILASSKFSDRLVRFTKATIGWMPGGLAIVTLVACAFFTAFTGASGVTIVALGGFLYPALVKEKYGEKFSIGLVTTSGSIGVLFPPSLPIIIYGVITSVDIDKLFTAGFIPGLLLIFALSIYSIFVSNKNKVERTKFDFKEFVDSLWEIRWDIPLPILLFAGIFTGKLALSDAAPFTVGYVLIIEMLIKKDIKPKDLPNIIIKSSIIVGSILLIMAVSFAASNYIVYKEIPQKLFYILQTFITNKYVFLIILNVFLLIVGCIMDIFSALVVIVPLIYPIAYEYNIDLIHLGVIFLTNLGIGYITPPVGMNLFISSLRFNKTIIFLYKACLSFIGILLIVLFTITYIPDLSLWFMEKPSIVGKWEYTDEEAGTKDLIILKTGNQLLRKKVDPNDLMSMFNTDYEIGDYYYKKGKIKFITPSSTEEYNLEIFNNGKKILLTDVDKNKKFYMNTLSKIITTNSGKLIGHWVSDKIKIEFLFNGFVNYEINGEIFNYLYEVKNNKIILKAESEQKEGTYKVIDKLDIVKINDSILELKNDGVLTKLILLKNNNDL